MRHLWQWFCGYVCIILHGRQVNRFINLCSKNGIHLWRISYDVEHAMHAHIRLKDFFYIKPYLRKTKTHMRVLSRRGFPFWCHRHPKMKWFLVCLVCCFVMFLYSFNFIWTIEITGNSRISDYELENYLSGQQIMVGTKRQEIDCPSLEYQLRENFDHLGWVSVSIQHTKLCIEIKESLYDPYEFEIIDGNEYDLIANKDAEIFSIITRSGTALVKTGQQVKAGEVLVKGICDIFDDAGAVKDTLLLKADATIWADVEYEFIDTISEIEIMALKLAGNYDDSALHFIKNQKFCKFIANLEKNGVIILDKDVMIDRKEKSIVFIGRIKAREQIGMLLNIPVEEIRANEFK